MSRSERRWKKGKWMSYWKGVRREKLEKQKGVEMELKCFGGIYRSFKMFKADFSL